MTTLGATLAYLKDLERDEDIATAMMDNYGQTTEDRKPEIRNRMADTDLLPSGFGMVRTGENAPALAMGLQ